MTREDKLYSLKGDMLIAECDKLGVKVSCNKSRTQLKESKSKVVDRILAFEANTAEVEETKISDTKTDEKLVPMPGIEKLEALKKEFPRHKSEKHKSENVDILLSYLNKANIKYKERFYKNNSLKCTAVYANTRKNKIMEIYPQKNGYALYIAKDIDLSGYDVISSNYGLSQRLSVDDVSIVSKILERC